MIGQRTMHIQTEITEYPLSELAWFFLYELIVSTNKVGDNKIILGGF